MHGEIVETDVAQKLYAIARFLEDVRGHLLLERRELERREPVEQAIDRQLAHLGDRARRDADLKRLGLQLRPMTIGTLLRRLIPPKEDADVLLVLLLLEIDEKWKNAFVTAYF